VSVGRLRGSREVRSRLRLADVDVVSVGLTCDRCTLVELNHLRPRVAIASDGPSPDAVAISARAGVVRGVAYG